MNAKLQRVLTTPTTTTTTTIAIIIITTANTTTATTATATTNTVDAKKLQRVCDQCIKADGLPDITPLDCKDGKDHARLNRSQTAPDKPASLRMRRPTKTHVSPNVLGSSREQQEGKADTLSIERARSISPSARHRRSPARNGAAQDILTAFSNDNTANSNDNSNDNSNSGNGNGSSPGLVRSRSKTRVSTKVAKLTARFQ